MTTIPLQTILAAIPSRVIAVLRDHGHSASDLVRHLTFCYTMLPVTPRGVQFDAADQNRLCREFCQGYCGEDGAVNWEKLLALNVGTGVEAQELPTTGTPRTDAIVQVVLEELSPVNPKLREHAEILEQELRESEAGAAALRAALEDTTSRMKSVPVNHTVPMLCVGDLEKWSAALSTNAGRELLAEVERLRSVDTNLAIHGDLLKEQGAIIESLQRKTKAAEGMAQALEIASRETYLTAQDGYKPTPTAVVCRAALTTWQEASK